MKNQEIVKLFTEENKTIREIANMFNLTSSRINQILHKELKEDYFQVVLAIVNLKRKEKFLVKSNCRLCGKPIERTTMKQYFCNKKCFYKFKKQNRIPNELKKAKRDKYARDYYLKKKYEK